MAAVPVVNAQVLTNPDGEGSLSQYITLATLAGAAAIAATPTLRVVTTYRRAMNQERHNGQHRYFRDSGHASTAV